MKLKKLIITGIVVLQIFSSSASTGTFVPVDVLKECIDINTQEISVTDEERYDYPEKTGYNKARKLLGDDFKSECVVAVIDTGADLDHPAYVDNLWQNEAEINGTPGVDDDNNGYVDDYYGINLIDTSKQPEDDTNNSHGTHVSGIIAMTGDYKGLGMDCRIMIIKAGNRNNKLTEDNIVKAIDYAVDNGADIINMSFGTSQVLDKAEEVLQKASKSCILVAAAGNNGLPTTNSIDYGYSTGVDFVPASYPYVTGVMALGKDEELASVSNWFYQDGKTEPKYTIIAPGEDVYSTTRNAHYGLSTGTSMSVPMVSGAYAVLLSYMKQNYKYADREELLSEAIEAMHSSDTYVAYIDKNGKEHRYISLNIYDSLKYLIEKHKADEAEKETETEKETAKPEKLLAPQNITLSVKQQNNSITINWKSVKKAKKYAIYRSENPKNGYKLIKTITGKSYTDKSVKTGRMYYYRVRALGEVKASDSNYSEAKKAVIMKATTRIIKRKGRVYTTVKWSKVNGASGYRVLGKTTVNGKYRQIRLTAGRQIRVRNSTGYRYIKVQTYKKILGIRFYGKEKVLKIK